MTPERDPHRMSDEALDLSLDPDLEPLKVAYSERFRKAGGNDYPRRVALAYGRDVGAQWRTPTTR